MAIELLRRHKRTAVAICLVDLLYIDTPRRVGWVRKMQATVFRPYDCLMNDSSNVSAQLALCMSTEFNYFLYIQIIDATRRDFREGRMLISFPLGPLLSTVVLISFWIQLISQRTCMRFNGGWHKNNNNKKRIYIKTATLTGRWVDWVGL